jgi:hypothetical protein
MLDLLAAVVLAALAFFAWRTLIRAGTPDPRTRRGVGSGVVAWFAVVVVPASSLARPART